MKKYYVIYILSFLFFTGCQKDFSIEEFVEKSNLPKSQTTEIIFSMPEKDITFFELKFGEPQDCFLGCFYSYSRGLKYGDKIGWFVIKNYDRSRIKEDELDELPVYEFTHNDSYLLSEDFLQELPTEFRADFLSSLVQNEDLPIEILREIAGLTEYSSYLKNSFLSNTKVRSDKETLKIMLESLPSSNYYERQSKAKVSELIMELE